MKATILASLMAAPAILLASSGPAIPADQRPADRARASVSASEDLVSYVVQPGDTAQSIVARGFHNPADWAAAAAFNRLPAKAPLKPGTVLILQSQWLKSSPIEARLAAWRGNVAVRDDRSARPLAKGMALREGDLVETSANSFATLILPDNSRVSLPSSSRIRIMKLRHVALTDSLDRRFRLEHGSSDAKVTPMKNASSRFLITTPVAVAAVRGTQYRVTFMPDELRQKTEVTEGKVGVYRLGATAREMLLPAGFGGFAARDGAGKPMVLLEAPSVEALPPQRQGKKVSIRLKASGGAAAYLFELATDPEFVDRIASAQVAQPVATFEDIDPGKIYVRFFAVAANGLVGKPGAASFDRAPDKALVQQERQEESRDQLAELGNEDGPAFNWYAAGSELDDALYAIAMGEAAGSGEQDAALSAGEGGNASESGAGWPSFLGGAGVSAPYGGGGGGWGGGGRALPGHNDPSGGGSTGPNPGNNGGASGSGSAGGGAAGGDPPGGEGGVVVIPTDPNPPAVPPVQPPILEPGGKPADGGGGGTTAPGNIPEPATWLMLVAGFGMIGTLVRRRRMAAR